MSFIPEFLKKMMAFMIAYSTAIVGGYIWFEAKIKAAEDNAIIMMKEYRKTDMEHLNGQLRDIKDDLRDVKRILMERK